MALFKPFRGNRASLNSVEMHDGYAYFCIDDGTFHIDVVDSNGNLQRKQINAKDAESIMGASLAVILNSSDIEIPTSKAVLDALAKKSDIDHTHVVTDISGLSDALTAMSANYDESIIGLSVDGQTVTYIKGDGSTHTFETQDTNTTYSLGTDTTTGLTKLYATTGSAEDGTMTQKAIKTELDKKVGVAIDDTQGMLIFTI